MSYLGSHYLPSSLASSQRSSSIQSTPYASSAAYFQPTPLQPSQNDFYAQSNDMKKDAFRKRPKYTRSKMGCLTCRTKKIKCDEIKPICTRCAQSQRECTWPEQLPPKKKSSGRKSDDRPSTTESERMSSSCSPPITRNQSPQMRPPSAMGGVTLPHRSNPSFPTHASFPPALNNIPHERRLSLPNESYLPPYLNTQSYAQDAVLQPIREMQYSPDPPTPVSAHSTHSMHHLPEINYYPPAHPHQHPSIPRPQDPVLPPLDMSRFPPPPAPPMHWHQSAYNHNHDMSLLDSYDRHQGHPSTTRPTSQSQYGR